MVCSWVQKAGSKLGPMKQAYLPLALALPALALAVPNLFFSTSTTLSGKRPRTPDKFPASTCSESSTSRRLQLSPTAWTGLTIKCEWIDFYDLMALDYLAEMSDSGLKVMLLC